ncbi:hypothetical protein [Hymenobacter sp. GOD-10R]|uniref:hypothetical protein n=1 Tax=Hymenobacter sp. GOD-10R TaxID=3093922 RepID=UPI002D77FBF0|nr:hypothetical protein [Hymenobacter sp. GOD-10R]WRQ26678.1 hypothetical protein SD425_16520 [Hymenobacter sp. GOD-10R]
MKTLYALAILLSCLLPTLVFAQVPSATPLKKANAILIETTDSATVAYRNMGRLLVTEGYTIAVSNADFATISTGDKPGKHGVLQAFTVLVTPMKAGSQIILTGTFADTNMGVLSPGVGYQRIPIANSGMKGSPVQNTWASLDALAKAYPGGKVLYLIK